MEIKKWQPVVRYNANNKIFKWEYDVRAVWGPRPKGAPRSPGATATSKMHQSAALTRKGAIRKARRNARWLTAQQSARKREWERV